MVSYGFHYNLRFSESQGLLQSESLSSPPDGHAIVERAVEEEVEVEVVVIELGKNAAACTKVIYDQKQLYRDFGPVPSITRDLLVSIVLGYKASAKWYLYILRIKFQIQPCTVHLHTSAFYSRRSLNKAS